MFGVVVLGYFLQGDHETECAAEVFFYLPVGTHGFGLQQQQMLDFTESGNHLSAV